MKPKVILDIAFLGYAYDEKSSRRGPQRVAHHLFEGLLDSNACDLSFVALSHLAGSYDFLQAHSLDLRQRLFLEPGKLQCSRLARKLVKKVRSTMEDRSVTARVQRRLLTAMSELALHNQSRANAGWLDQADIFHSPQTPFTPEVKAHPRIRRVITVYDFQGIKNPDLFPESRPFMQDLLSSLQRDTVALCISEAVRQDLLNFSQMAPEQSIVTPLAADPHTFHPVAEPVQLSSVRTRYNLGSSPYFLALSAFDRHKNFPHLIECLELLCKSRELIDHNLVIVGPNPARNPILQEVLGRFPKLIDRIILPGYIPDEDLAAVYSGAIAFLFPSIIEGFGIPPLEAMQCGVPVISSGTTSMPEVIGDAGILLPPDDREAWCEAMLLVARDGTVRANMREKSLRRCQLFSWRRFIEETLRGYQISMALK